MERSSWPAASPAAYRVAGCGPGDPVDSPGPTPTHTPPTVDVIGLADRCSVEVDAETQPFAVSSANGEELYAVEARRGDRAIVLVHGSGTRGLCNWTNEMPWLAESGFRVIAFDGRCIGSSTCREAEDRPIDDLLSVVLAARTRGATESLVVAASAGGPLAVQAAAQPNSGVRSVVALSPVGLEEPFTTRDATAERNVGAAVKALVPILYVLAPDDSAASVTHLEEFQRVSPGSSFEQLPAGAGHAQEVLYDEARGPSSFRSGFLAFIRK